MQIVDAHLDIAYNALKYGRDPLRTVQEQRELEKPDPDRGTATVSFPQLREGGAVLIFGTLFATPIRSAALLGGGIQLTYRNQAQAHQLAMNQLDYYHRLVDEEQNHLRLVGDMATLDEVLTSQLTEEPLLGIVPLMEGADPIREPGELELWIEKGVRAVGLAWDDTRYAAGSFRDSRQGITKAGVALLEIMADFNVILDLSHMTDLAAFEALERYDGPIVASHSNARAIVPGKRQLSDALIRQIADHEGVVGIALFNPFLRANHRKGDSKEAVTLNDVFAHIDYICQMFGDAAHVGLGTDMDGGFGAEDIPTSLDSCADLALLAAQLAGYGYAEADIARIMSGNWLRLLRTAFAP